MLYTNPEDLLKALNLADSQWYGNGDNHCHWIFRGQRNSIAPLQPSISRGNTYNEIFDIVHPTLIRYNLMPTYDHIALDIINRYKSS